jgi:hypothetical protein
MKKQLVILGLLINQLPSLGQGRTINTTTPCTDEVLYKTPGKWFKYTDVWQVDHIAFNKSQQQEVVNRVDKIHAMMQQAYPDPKGLDVAWHRALGYSTFGDQVTYIRKDEFSLDRETLVERPVASFGYVAGFFRHFCSTTNPNEIWSGYPGETGTWFNLNTNSFNGFATEYFGNFDTLTIGGYPVHLRPPLKQSFDGYQIFYSKGNVDNPDITPERLALVHRKGELPYIPVTRKQYLEKCIAHLPKSLDIFVKGLEQMPATTAEDREARKQQLAELKKNNEAILSRYQNELEETTRQGLLDTPAIIPLTIYNTDESSPIFTEEDKGFMIVRVNPGYLRKELPKHVPQFFVMFWKWNDWQPQADVGNLIEEKFPFKNLLEMIDK